MSDELQAGIIKNDGSLIEATDFWQLAIAKAGKFYLSINAGCFRLLVPRSQEQVIREMRTARQIVVTRGMADLDKLPGGGKGQVEALEILFEDGSADPFALFLDCAYSVQRIPADSDIGGTFDFTAWTHLVGLRGRLAYGPVPCYYRRSLRLPDLRPWTPIA